MLQYVDGAEVHATALTGNVASVASAVYLGCRKGAALGQFFVGSLDEVVLHTRALSDELSDYVRRSAPPSTD